jgi:hypothetical protein
MRIETYKWHSINLIPHFAFYSICRDTGFDITGRVFALTVFGLVITFMWRTKKIGKFYASPMIGPTYSRKKKVWKFLNDFTRF